MTFKNKKALVLALTAGAAIVSAPLQASAQYKGPPIKIGVLNDQSSLYADIAGPAASSPRNSRSRISAPRKRA